jgi:glycopeptide antibiotics resistance protein
VLGTNYSNNLMALPYHLKHKGILSCKKNWLIALSLYNNANFKIEFNGNDLNTVPFGHKIPIFKNGLKSLKR